MAQSLGILDNHQVRFGAVLGAVSLAAIAVLLFNRPGGLDIGTPVEAVQRRLKSRHLTRTARELDRACNRKDCACALSAARAALDADAGDGALALFSAGKTCEWAQAREASDLRAEALVQTGKIPEGLALARRPGAGAHAAQARALAAYRSGTWPAALAEAQAAIGAGRGAPAHLLAGLASYQTGALQEARTELQAALAAEPDDLNALYDLALVADKQDRYGEARTLCLRVLTLDPKNKAARYRLGVMAHAIGAEAEAKHHLEKLEAVAPGDPLVADLRKVLATPAHLRGPVLSIGLPSPPQNP